MSEPILIVDDDPEASDRLAAALGRAGLCATVAPQIHQCIVLARQLAPELVILSLALREVDGLRVLRTLRRHGVPVPVLVLAPAVPARSAELLRAAGADRVVPQGTPLAEVVTQVVTLWREAASGGRAARLASYALPPAAPVLEVPHHAPGGAPAGTGTWSAHEPEAAEVRFGDVVLRPATRQLWRRGRRVALRPREMDVLLALCRRATRAVSRATLLREVWGAGSAASGRAVDNCVVALRRALEEVPSLPRHICTVRRIGYRLDLEPVPRLVWREPARGAGALWPHAACGADGRRS